MREAEALILDSFRADGIELIGSPDYVVINESLFGIDEARKLSDFALRKAFGEKKVFLIAPEKITDEAQNALLKTFEEPIEGTHFFLVLRDSAVLLPTLRSRLQVLSLEEGEMGKDAEKFLSMNVKERLAFVKKFVDAEKNLSHFLDDLLSMLKERGKSEALQAVYPLRLVSDQRGTSARLVLEHLSLVL